MTTVTTSNTLQALLQSDIEKAIQFLGLLDPDATRFEFRAIWPPGRPMPDTNDALPNAINKRGDLTNVKVSDELTRLNQLGYGIFVTVNETNGVGVKKENIKRVRAVWADWDDGIPDTVPLAPSRVIRTSPERYQAYWLLDDDGMEFGVFASVMERITTTYDGDKNCKDLARVLRVPGFNHTKGDPYRVRGVKFSGAENQVYTAAQLAKAFPPVEAVSSKQGRSVSAVQRTKLRYAAQPFDAARVTAALEFIHKRDADYVSDHATWLSVGMAIHHGSSGSAEGFAVYDTWSQFSDKYKPGYCKTRWASFGKEKKPSDDQVTLGSVFHKANELGFNKIEVVPVTDDGLTAIEFGVGVEKWDKEQIDEMLSRMNREHAVVSIGGKVRFLHRTRDDQDRPTMRFLGSDDITTLYQHIGVRRTDDKRPITAIEAWKSWKQRKYYAGVGMYPGEAKVPSGYLNLWQGFAIEPKAGDWSLFREHLHKCVCGGDDVEFAFLMDWLSHAVQKPHEKPGSAIVLKSEAKGSGKSMLIKFMRDIFGAHAMGVSKADHVTGNFNAHLQRTIILGVEEAVWAGNKSAEGAIKSLITEPFITIEQKGLDAIEAVNYTRLIFTSNEHWVIPVGTTERRFLVLQVENPRANDPKYFGPIWEQMDHEGGTAAMLHELMERRIKSDLFNPPQTDALVQQRAASLNSVQQWLRRIARDGELRSGSGEVVVLGDDKVQAYCADVRADAERACRGYEGRQLDNILGALLKDVGAVKIREPRGARRYVYAFPRLSEFQRAVKDALKIDSL
jgi:hypothetical protein